MGGTVSVAVGRQDRRSDGAERFDLRELRPCPRPTRTIARSRTAPTCARSGAGDVPELSASAGARVRGQPGNGLDLPQRRAAPAATRARVRALPRADLDAARRPVHHRAARRRCLLATAGRLAPARWRSSFACSPGSHPRAREDTPRLLRFFQIADAKHPREPHWYLALLGVDPDHQGRGFGSHLMQPVLTRCDRESIARVPRDRHRAKRRVLRAPRLRRHGEVRPARRRAADLVDVAGASRRSIATSRLCMSMP